MHTKDFNDVMQDLFEKCESLLVSKGVEYSTDDDKLHNFKRAASLTPGGRPQDALAGYMLKHTISVYDMVTSERRFSPAAWDEKIVDHINYLILLKALVVEQHREGSPSDQASE